MICFRLLDAKDPAQPLADAVHALAQGTPTKDTYAVDPVSFRHVPNAPFAYWVSDTIRKLFTTLPPFENEERTAKVGLQTADDFRFVRCSWETPITPEELTHRNWYHFAKGGSYSPFYADIYLKVNWANEGNEMETFTGSVIRNSDYYFRPGLTWPRRSTRMRVAPVPKNCIFSNAGMLALTKNEQQLKELLFIMGSHPFDSLCRLRTGSHGGSQFEVGIILKTPLPNSAINDQITKKSLQCIAINRLPNTANTTSHAFVAPALAPQKTHLS
jgi:hypothetical protein